MKFAHTHSLVLVERLILLACLLITSTDCAASQWLQHYQISYSMGENESRMSVRKAALEDARARASSEFGAVVLNQQDLKDNDLVERTKLISAGLVKLQVESEQLSVHGGVGFVEFTIRAEIDDSELDRQLAAMRQDVRKADLVLKLSQENADLRARLQELRESIARAGSGQLPQETATQITDLLTRLAGNNEAISTQFRRGSLSEVSRQVNEQARERLERTFYLPMLESKVEAHMGIPSEINGFVQVPVRLRWQFDTQEVKKTAREFSSLTQEDGIKFHQGFCSRVYPVDGVMSQTGQLIADEGIALEVSVGQWREYFVIGGSKMPGVFCLVDRTTTPARTVVLSIPQKIADTANSMSVRVVRMSAVDKNWKQTARWDLMNGNS